MLDASDLDLKCSGRMNVNRPEHCRRECYCLCQCIRCLGRVIRSAEEFEYKQCHAAPAGSRQSFVMK